MSDTEQIELTVRLRSPLCIARRPTAPGQPVETLSYVSGTVLRGAVATVWLRGRRYEELTDMEQATFRKLFLQSQLNFGDCWPIPELHDDRDKPIAASAMIVPQTAWTAKHGGGWRNDPEGGKGVEDMLRRMLLGINLGDDMDRYKSLFAALTPVPATYRSFEIRKRQIARTAIDSMRGTARPRRLYTLEALEADQRFRGLIGGQTDLLARLRECVLIEDVPLSLGQGRSRGLGEAVLDRAERPTLQPGTRATMAEEVHSFNELLHKDYEHLYYAAGKIPYPYGDDLLLPVTLESDVLLRDSYLLPSTDPRPMVTLGRYLPLPPPLDTEMRLVEAGVVQSTHWIGGWDELRRLPRPPQLATAAGSVWTFRLAPALLDTALDWWDAAQRNGLGERRAEGFGRIRLCHPLHLTEGPQ